MQVPTKDPSRFVETVIDDEIVLMALDTGDFFSLKDTARSAWQLLDGTRDTDAVVGALAAEYDKNEGEIRQEVEAFLGELNRAGLLKS